MSLQINDSVFEAFPELESERLLFRDFQARDAEDLFFLKTDDQVMAHMDSKKHQSLEDTLELIRNNQTSFVEQTGLNWAIIDKAANRFIGYFGYWRLDKANCRGEIGYSLHPDYWGHGYMKETFSTLIPFGFKTLHLHSIEANINPNNANSERLLVSFGFQKEAYFRENYLYNGVYLDSIIYCLLEEDIK
ncbi:GNAT family N-acetyltransferase [Hanstruepera ponticola]|uniref:GNAT family N-acetyltransferase n=1 Tax=Hanstruepera ponticola TaxID=2042995 RepID=UPI000CF02EDE|nr:GNAT family N-acetyltransferase [Hanstruepera ponticola]